MEHIETQLKNLEERHKRHKAMLDEHHERKHDRRDKRRTRLHQRLRNNRSLPIVLV